MTRLQKILALLVLQLGILQVADASTSKPEIVAFHSGTLTLRGELYGPNGDVVLTVFTKITFASGTTEGE